MTQAYETSVSSIMPFDATQKSWVPGLAPLLSFPPPSSSCPLLSRLLSSSMRCNAKRQHCDQLLAIKPTNLRIKPCIAILAVSPFFWPAILYSALEFKRLFFVLFGYLY
jgi:hypothetical protein